MAAASDYTERNILNSLLRGQPFPVPDRVWIALHTTNPGDSGGGEVSTVAWPSYSRQDAAQSGPIADAWTVPSLGPGLTKNTLQILFPVFNGTGTITITHFSLHDALTGGNMLVHMPLVSSRTLEVGDVFVINEERLEIQAL